MHIIERGKTDRCNTLLCATCNHYPGITTANSLPGFPNSVAAGSTGGDSCAVGTPCPKHDRDNTRRAINYHHIDKERTDTIRSLFIQDFELVMQCNQATNTTADIDTDIISKIIGDFQPCMV